MKEPLMKSLALAGLPGLALRRAATTTTQFRHDGGRHRDGRCNRDHGRGPARHHGNDRSCRRRETAPRHRRATKVKLQLQWVTQAQFAGYYAAVDQGFYKARASTSRSSKAASTSFRRRNSQPVPSTTPSPGCRRLWPRVSRAPGSPTSPRSSSVPARFRCQLGRLQHHRSRPISKGKKVGNWGFGNEFELFAGMTKAGLDPAKDVTLVQQQFDMQALLKREIDAAQAMTYNEYAQVLEAKNPDTGELYTAGGVQRHRLERRRHCDAAGRHLGQHGQAQHDAAYKDQTATFREGLHCRAGCSAVTTPTSASTSSWRRVPSSARATRLGR